MLGPKLCFGHCQIARDLSDKCSDLKGMVANMQTMLHLRDDVITEAHRLLKGGRRKRALKVLDDWLKSP